MHESLWGAFTRYMRNGMPSEVTLLSSTSLPLEKIADGVKRLVNAQKEEP